MERSYWNKVLDSRLSRRRAIAATGALGGAAAFLAACGGGDDDSPSSSGPAGPKDTSGLLANITDETKNAKKGGTYIGSHPGVILTHDPMKTGINIRGARRGFSQLLRVADGFMAGRRRHHRRRPRPVVRALARQAHADPEARPRRRLCAGRAGQRPHRRLRGRGLFLEPSADRGYRRFGGLERQEPRRTDHVGDGAGQQDRCHQAQPAQLDDSVADRLAGPRAPGTSWPRRRRTRPRSRSRASPSAPGRTTSSKTPK